jgi:hypothetical protein
MSVFRPLDRWLFAFITQGWLKNRISGYVKSLRVDDAQSNVPNVVAETFKIIDVKATALLTHTSMMIAALGLVAPIVADDRIEQGVIVAEILMYLVVAMGCLRCISIFGEHEIHPSRRVHDEMSRNELILRRQLFIFCNRATIALTALIFISLPLLYFYVPKKVAL